MRKLAIRGQGGDVDANGDVVDALSGPVWTRRLDDDLLRVARAAADAQGQPRE